MHYLRTEAWHRARMQALARKQQGFIINPYAFATGGGGGPAGVVSLLHFNGSNGSSTFTDETGKTWTANTGAQISTTESVFGGASGSFDGASGYISTPDHADWDFGSGDFTLEGRSWFFSVAGGSNYSLINKSNGAGYTPWGLFKFGTNFALYMSSNGTSWDIASNVVLGTVAANTWYVWSISRQGSTIYTHLDGVAAGTASSAAALYSSSDDVRMGGWTVSPYYQQGYTDEFRAIKGTGLYAGNYTPDTSQFVYP